MDNEQIEQELSDIELRVERLRALYEQYFIGIEKLEPLVARKDLERKIWALRREQIRNTGLRFKFNTLTQRYNTYQQYWHRILREIETGTYRRDVIKVAKRFGDKESLTISGRKRAEAFARLAENQEARKVREHGYDPADALEDGDVGVSRRGSYQPAPAPMDVTDDVHADFESGVAQPVASAVSSQPERPLPLAPAVQKSGARDAPKPLLGFGFRRQPAAPAPVEVSPPSRPAQSEGATSPRSGLRLGRRTPPPAPARGQLPTQPMVEDADAPTPKPVVQDVRPPPPRPVGMRGLGPPRAPPEPNQERLAQLAGMGRRAPKPEDGRPPPDPSRRTQPDLAQQASPPRQAPPAQAAPPRADDEGFRKVYDQFVEARKNTNEGLSGVTYDRVAAGLRAQADKLRKQHEGKKVDYEVVVKDGKTMIKPVLR